MHISLFRDEMLVDLQPAMVVAVCNDLYRRHVTLAPVS